VSVGFEEPLDLGREFFQSSLIEIDGLLHELADLLIAGAGQAVLLLDEHVGLLRSSPNPPSKSR
jgi:hypothetical protein